MLFSTLKVASSFYVCFFMWIFNWLDCLQVQLHCLQSKGFDFLLLLFSAQSPYQSLFLRHEKRKGLRAVQGWMGWDRLWVQKAETISKVCICMLTKRTEAKGTTIAINVTLHLRKHLEIHLFNYSIHTYSATFEMSHIICGSFSKVLVIYLANTLSHTYSATF